MPDATTFATYDYGPFGELIRATGPYAAANSYRFSTKPQDVDTGHLYYNYRPYSTKIGRWLTRDPVEENGGLNLYGFVGNSGVGKWDVLGQSILPYEIDTNSIPLDVGQVASTSLAETDVRNWEYSGITSLTWAAYFSIGSNEVLELKGRLKITITKRAGVADNYLKLEENNSGFTVAEHERHHAWLCKQAYNKAAIKANLYEGKYCGGCGDKAKRLALATMGLALEEQFIENKSFDRFDYSGGQVTEIDTIRYFNAKREYNDAENEYNKSKCKKL
jgi:RHS repeat-associated protein